MAQNPGKMQVSAPRPPKTLGKMQVSGPRPPKHLKNGPISMKFDGLGSRKREKYDFLRFFWVPEPWEAKKKPKMVKIQSPKSENGSQIGPITTDFDETWWDLLPPMRPRS